ncbi:MAG: S58 family peptidase, partial [Gemmatimonadales bacterium]|nr:S58 family peptidase [Gemmatimonadales bacterium]
VTVGVLVQSNFGGSLRIDGVRVGEKLAAAGLRGGRGQGDGDGSVMIVIATDLPLAHRELDRVADRSFMGLARTGSYMSHGSGDYAIAFSTGEGEAVRGGGALSRVFAAVVEATDEAVINSLFRATTVTGHGGRTVEALPLEPTLGWLREAGVLGTSR